MGAIGARARHIRNFLSQPFFVAEAYTKRPGAFVALRETIAAFRWGQHRRRSRGMVG